MLDVEIDVRGTVAFWGEEPLEEQPEGDRVGFGDAERVADGAVGGTPPPLAVDVMRGAEPDDVDQQQEVPREVEGLDDIELVRELAHRLLVARMGRRIAHRGAARGEPTEPGHVGVAWWHVEIGKVRGGQPQIKGARLGDLEGAFHGPGPTGEAAGLFR